MALTEVTRLYELLVRVERDASGDRVRGMHAQAITEIYRDGDLIAANLEPPVPVGWAEVAGLMHPDDRAALAAALAAAE